MVYFGKVYELLLNLLWEVTSVIIFERQLVYYFELPEPGRPLLVYVLFTIRMGGNLYILGGN